MGIKCRIKWAEESNHQVYFAVDNTTTHVFTRSTNRNSYINMILNCVIRMSFVAGLKSLHRIECTRFGIKAPWDNHQQDYLTYDNMKTHVFTCSTNS